MPETVHSFNTILKDRTLWYDGDSTVSERYIIDRLIQGNTIEGLFVDQLTPKIKKANGCLPKSEQIRVKTGVEIPQVEWLLSPAYKNLDIDGVIFDLAYDYCIKHKHENTKKGSKVIARVVKELTLFKQHNLTDVLKVLFFIINTLETKNVVWGVGRGSSVSSFVLYLIGVHDVDSIKYDLPIEDFIRD